MSPTINSNGFLWKKFNYVESLELEGKDHGFESFLKEKGIPVSNEQWELDHSLVNWKAVTPFFQLNYDNVNERDLSNWFLKSRVSEFDYLFTWLDRNEPIIKVKTKDFIDNWFDFNVYSGWEGIVLTTENGELFFEFTDDWKSHLNSNFMIKPS